MSRGVAGDDGSTTNYDSQHMRVLSPAGGSGSTHTSLTEFSGPMYDNNNTNNHNNNRRPTNPTTPAMLQQQMYDAAARAASDPTYMAPNSQTATDPSYMYAQSMRTGDHPEYRPVLPMAPVHGGGEAYNPMQQRSAKSYSSLGSELPYKPNGVEYMAPGSFDMAFFEHAEVSTAHPPRAHGTLPSFWALHTL